jgi:cytochrome c peroxidase
MLSSCSLFEKEKEDIAPTEKYELNIPKGWPAPFIPAENKLTKERVELGKMLFFDPILSLDNTVSCSSCHLPSRAFTDNKKLSHGVGDSLTLRNSPTVINVAYIQNLFWDGGVISLDLLAIAPIENKLEMHLPMEEAVNRLKNHPHYPGLFRKAYNQEVDDINLPKALAAYVRTLIMGNSPYDKYINGDSTALSSSQKLGLSLFMSEKTNCNVCHSGFLFTNQTYQNNGLQDEYKDFGRYLVTTRVQDFFKYKVPSLRNVALTYPYMHNGGIETLEEVVKLYNQGGKGHPFQSHLIKPLGLTAEEEKALVDFLKSLSEDF